MKQTLGLVIAGVTSAALSGCALNAYMPNQRFQLPESEGQVEGEGLKLSVTGQTRRVTKMNYTSDLTTIAPNPDTPSFDSDSSITLGVNLGLIPKLDAYFDWGMINSASIVGVKYQLLGDSRRAAKEGNSSLALTVGYLFESHSGKVSDQGQAFGSTERAAEYDFALSGADLGLIYGYRPIDVFLVYGGVFGNFSRTSGSWNRTKPYSQEVDLKSSVRQQGMNLGISTGYESFQGMIEVSYTELRAGSNRTNETSIGGGIRIVFK